MTNQEELELLELGRDVWNNWRREHPQVPLDFMDAILEYANHNGVDLSGARHIGVQTNFLRKSRDPSLQDTWPDVAGISSRNNYVVLL